MSRSIRLLALLQHLRERRAPVTAKDLARELEVSERTIFRDIVTLASMGAPIKGEAGVGYVLRPGLFLPPLMLSEDEVEAIMLGLRYVDQRGDAPLRAAATSAGAKIDSVLSPAARAARDALMSMPGPDGGAIPDAAVPASRLRAAIRQQRKLFIAYANADGQRTQRTVWPFALAFLDDVRILAGWCELRSDFRMFRIDRIASAEERDRYTEPRASLLRRFRAKTNGPERS
jgi:predicted DNA-binding transcriptional regulator YafY